MFFVAKLASFGPGDVISLADDAFRGAIWVFFLRMALSASVAELLLLLRAYIRSMSWSPAVEASFNFRLEVVASHDTAEEINALRYSCGVDEDDQNRLSLSQSSSSSDFEVLAFVTLL